MRTTLLALLLACTCLTGCRGIRPSRDGKPIARDMRVTGYCKCGECCSWRRTWYGRAVYASGPNKGKRKVIGLTASGSMARPGTIAADTSRYPFGTIMYIEGYGYGRVEDRGGAIKGEHIDLYFRSHEQARQWGSQKLRIYVWPAGA